MPSSSILRAWCVLALMLLVASAGLTRLRTNDLFIHLKTGAQILDEGTIPDTDRYSFTAEGARYVTHEWLAASYYAVGQRVGGVAGVIVASKLLPGLAILAALLAAFRAAGVQPAIGCAVATVALAVARNRMTQDRPELIALALLMTLLWLLLRDRARARRDSPDRLVLWAVPLTAVWANVHASFLLGIALVVAFAIAEPIDALLWPRDRRARRVAIAGAVVAFGLAAFVATLSPASFARPAAATIAAVALLFAADAFTGLFASRDDGTDRRWQRTTLRLGGLAAAMLAAISLNPHGFEIYLFPFEFTAGVNTVTQRIGEWRPLLEAPFLLHSFELSAYLVYLALVAAALALAASRGVLDRRELGVIVLFGILPLRHIRWMALFALATAPALAAMLSRAREAPVLPRQAARRAVAWIFLIAAAAAVLAAASQLRGERFDVVFTAALALVAGSAAAAIALAARRSNSPIDASAGLVFAGGLCMLFAVLAIAQGIPARRGLQLDRGFQWRALERVGGNLVDAAPAVEFLARNRVRGHLLTEYAWAGYAIHELWPDIHVFVDSRSEVYGDELLALLLDMPNRPALAKRAIEQYGVDLVLVRYRPYPYNDRLLHNAGILDTVADDPRWGLLYFDDGAALYARRGAGRALPTFFEHADPRKLTPGVLARTDPELERELRVAILRAPRSSIGRFALASQLRAGGQVEAARALLAEAWQVNPLQPAAPELAGRLAEAARDHAAARMWYERTLEAAPIWTAVKLRAEALEP